MIDPLMIVMKVETIEATNPSVATPSIIPTSGICVQCHNPMCQSLSQRWTVLLHAQCLDFVMAFLDSLLRFSEGVGGQHPSGILICFFPLVVRRRD